MNLKFDVAKKTIKELNSDDFSAEDLNSYIFGLNNDLIRVNKEIKKKLDAIYQADSFFN
jgi:Zn-dependent M16 (insulinase) family peptidase